MKKGTVAALVVGAVVFGLFVGAVGIAYAETDTQAGTQGQSAWRGPGAFIADLLGLSQDEFIEQRRAGESLPKIAEDAGVSVDELVDQLYSERLERLEALLADGLITQEQYEWARANLKERIEEGILGDRIMGGPGFGHGPGMGPGAGRGGFGHGGWCGPEVAPDGAPEVDGSAYGPGV
ncbi:MAG: hypothetical protein Kow0056_04550 [Coriobacteriia bacterium]